MRSVVRFANSSAVAEWTTKDIYNRENVKNVRKKDIEEKRTKFKFAKQLFAWWEKMTGTLHKEFLPHFVSSLK